MEPARWARALALVVVARAAVSPWALLAALVPNAVIVSHIVVAFPAVKLIALSVALRCEVLTAIILAKCQDQDIGVACVFRRKSTILDQLECLYANLTR